MEKLKVKCVVFYVFLCLLNVYAYGLEPVERENIPYEMTPTPQLPASFLDDMAKARSMAPPELTSPSKVAVLVDSELYPEFAPDISNYKADVEASFPVEILVYSGSNYRNMTFEGVRSELKSIWQAEGIKGAVLVGFFPIMKFHVPGQGLKPMGQIMGYEDLDGIFTDEGYYTDDGSGMVFHYGSPDGVYDHHRWNNNGMEIWCAMIRPYQSSSSSTDYTADVRDQLHNFFDRCHLYYNRQTVIPRRGLAYVNYDWRGGDSNGDGHIDYGDGYNLETIHSQTYGAGSSVAYYGGRNSGYRFMEERASGFEIAYLYCHSASWFHQFDRGMLHDVQSTDLTYGNGRGSVITYGFNCHGADFLETPTGCVGQRYIFDSELGQTYVGSMISMGIVDIIKHAYMLKNGAYLGEAFYTALNAAYQKHQGFSITENHHTIWAQTILGNPFVTAAASRNFSAVPSSVSGSVNGSGDVRLTVTRDGNIVAIVYSQGGSFTISGLPAGNFTVMVETLAGDRIGFLNLSLTAGQNLTGWDIALPNYGMQVNNWYYFHKTSGRTLPSDWNSAGANMSLWDGQGPAPVGYDEEAAIMNGTGINSYGDESGTVYVRKDFTVSAPGQQQKIWVYGVTQNGNPPQVWVNGTAVTMTSIDNRTDLTYWQYRGDITEMLNGGTNFIVAGGYAHLDISAPVYSTDDLVDNQAPIPDPMRFAQMPAAAGARSVTMTAVTAEDTHFDAEYYFECIAGDGHDSGWQSNPVYTDAGLQPGTYYAYRVKSRDTSSNQNEGGYSEAAPVSTFENPADSSDVYDGMEYGTGVADGSYGWRGAWINYPHNGLTKTAPFGLTYPGLLTEGYCKKMAALNTSSEVNYRNLQNTYSSGTVWMSVLLRAEKIGDGHFFIAPKGNGLEGAIGKRWGSKFAINNNSSNIIMQEGRTYLLVGRYDLRSGNDTTYLWVNPAIDSEPQTADADVTKSDRDLYSISKIELNLSGYGGGVFFADEIRLGRTWDEVIGNADYYCPAMPEGDLNGDCRVELDDLLILCNRWLTPSVFGESGISDLADISANWLCSERVRYDSN